MIEGRGREAAVGVLVVEFLRELDAQRTSSNSDRPVLLEPYVISLVAQIEGYVDTIIESRLSEHNHEMAESPISEVIDEYLLRVTASWPNRRGALKTVARISIGESDYWPAFNAAIDLRNALVHGHGHLTRHQLRNPLPTIESLSRIGVFVDAGRVVLAPETWGLIVAAAIGLVRWLAASIAAHELNA